MEYQWVECHAGEVEVELDGETSSYFIPDSEGYYAVITSSGDCIDTSECLYFDFSSIYDFDNQFFVLYPNPNEGIFSIEFSRSGSYEIEIVIYNVLGEEVYRKENITANSTVIDRNGMDTGVYLLSVINQSNEAIITTQKLIVR